MATVCSGLNSVLSSSGGCSTGVVIAVIFRFCAGILKVRVRCLKASSVSGLSAASIRVSSLPSEPLTTHWAKRSVAVS